MMEEIREVPGGPRARMTGGVYVLYFVTAIAGAALIGRGAGGAGKVVAYRMALPAGVLAMRWLGLSDVRYEI